MGTIQLTKPFMIKGEEVNEIMLDFDKLTGNDLIEAEKETRALGDNTPIIAASMKYQAAVAARMIGCPVDDVIALPAADFKKLIAPVMHFFIV